MILLHLKTILLHPKMTLLHLKTKLLYPKMTLLHLKTILFYLKMILLRLKWVFLPCAHAFLCTQTLFLRGYTHHFITHLHLDQCYMADIYHCFGAITKLSLTFIKPSYHEYYCKKRHE